MRRPSAEAMLRVDPSSTERVSERVFGIQPNQACKFWLASPYSLPSGARDNDNPPKQNVLENGVRGMWESVAGAAKA